MKGVAHTPRGHQIHTVWLWNTCFIYWWNCIIFITVFINLNRSASMYALQVSSWNHSRGCCMLHYLNLLYFCSGLFVVFLEFFPHLSSAVFTFFSGGDSSIYSYWSGNEESVVQIQIAQLKSRHFASLCWLLFGFQCKAWLDPLSTEKRNRRFQF